MCYLLLFNTTHCGFFSCLSHIELREAICKPLRLSAGPDGSWHHLTLSWYLKGRQMHAVVMSAGPDGFWHHLTLTRYEYFILELKKQDGSYWGWILTWIVISTSCLSFRPIQYVCHIFSKLYILFYFILWL